MGYTTVVLASALVDRHGTKQPGYVYLVSTAIASATGNIGLYEVLIQPGVNPYPARDARWIATLAAMCRRDSIDPGNFHGDLRDYLTAVGKSYIVYYFVDAGGGWARAYVQHHAMPRDRFVVYDTDVYYHTEWRYAAHFRYLGVEHHPEWM